MLAGMLSNMKISHTVLSFLLHFAWGAQGGGVTGGHAHLVKPGYLCIKQALGACANKLLENGLGTHRRTSYLLTASGVGTRSSTWITAVE